MLKRKGFTLVELVIVIAVIAILAGVLIGTFASVINRANESARLQELKAQEIEQKADDIIKKIEDSDWFGWEDFEASVVAKLTEAYKRNSNSVSTDDIKAAVSVAMKEYADSHANDKTSLTEDQVKAIIENALGTLKFEGVTEAQVKAIVTTATSDIQGGQVSEEKIKQIVNTANEKNLTSADVAKVVGEAVKGLSSTANINDAVAQIVSSVNTATAGALSKDDVVKAILELVPVTYTIKSESDLTAALNSAVSFSNLDFTTDYASNVTITLPSTDTRTLTISGAKLAHLTVNAPNANIYVKSEVEELTVAAVASSSLHLFNKVTTLVANSGRVVLEAGAVVEKLDVKPTQNAVVEVALRSGASVEDLNVKYQNNEGHDTVKVSNNGGELGNVNLSGGSDNTSTNLILDSSFELDELKIASTDNATYKVEQNGGEYVGTKDDTFVSDPVTVNAGFVGAGTESDPYLIRNKEELLALSLYVNGNESDKYMGTDSSVYYKLTADIDLVNETWVPLGNELSQKLKNVSIDGAGHTINGLSNLASYKYRGTLTVSHSSKVKGYDYAFIKYTEGNIEIKDVKFTNVNINFSDAKQVAALIAISGQDINNATSSSITITNVDVDGKIETGHKEGDAAALIAYARWLGPNNAKGSGSQNITISGCDLDVELGGGRPVGLYIARTTIGLNTVSITSSDTEQMKIVGTLTPQKTGKYVGSAMSMNKNYTVIVNGETMSVTDGAPIN